MSANENRWYAGKQNVLLLRSDGVFNNSSNVRRSALSNSPVTVFIFIFSESEFITRCSSISP